MATQSATPSTTTSSSTTQSSTTQSTTTTPTGMVISDSLANMNYSKITTNRPAYATEISLVLLILAIALTSIINEISQTQGQKIRYALTVLFILGVYIIITVLFAAASKIDLQMQIGNRLVKACGGSQYYQKETGDELVASLILDPSANPLLGVKDLILMFQLIFLMSIVAFVGIIVPKLNKEDFGQLLKFWKVTDNSLIKNNYLKGFVFLIIASYFVYFIIALVSEIINNIKNKANKMNKINNIPLPAYITAKIAVPIIIIGLFYAYARLGTHNPPLDLQYFDQYYLYIPFIIILAGLCLLIYFSRHLMGLLNDSVNIKYKQALTNKLNDEIVNTPSLFNRNTGDYVTPTGSKNLQTVLYNAILDLEPNTNDTVQNAITMRKGILYQYIKHNNGNELMQLNGTLSDQKLTQIRSYMNQLRHFTGISDTFGWFIKTVYRVFIVATIFLLYLVFHINYSKNNSNNSQFVMVIIFTIIVLLFITCIFAWYSNSLLVL